jgi:RNA polymerase sigma-70 factor (ECF subfamily)
MTGNSRSVALSVMRSTGSSLSVGAPAPTGARPDAIDFESVYAEHFSFVWRMARRLGVADEALDDVCQEVFVVVHRRLHEFEGRSSLKTWVFGILHNVVLVHHRALGRKSPAHRSAAPLVDPETLVDAAAGPYEQLSNAQASAIAQRLLDQVDEDKRTILVLVELEEMSVAEVSEAIGLNLNTTHARLRAARKQFTQAVTRYRAREQWRIR